MIFVVKEETPFILIGANVNGHSPWWALLTTLGILWGRWWKIAFYPITLL